MLFVTGSSLSFQQLHRGPLFLSFRAGPKALRRKLLPCTTYACSPRTRNSGVAKCLPLPNLRLASDALCVQPSPSGTNRCEARRGLYERQGLAHGGAVHGASPASNFLRSTAVARNDNEGALGETGRSQALDEAIRLMGEWDVMRNSVAGIQSWTELSPNLRDLEGNPLYYQIT